MKMKDLVSRYLEWQLPSLAKETHKNVVSDLTRMATAWDKTRRVANRVDEEWLVDFMMELRAGKHGRGKQLAPSTYNKSVERYRAFFMWMVRRGHGNALILDVFRPIRVDDRKEFLQLSTAQVVHMIETCADPWERWVLAFGSQTLGRDSELLNRQVLHLHMDRGVLDWYRKKTTDMDKLPITQPLATEWERWVWEYQRACGSIQPHWPLVPQRLGRPGRWCYRPSGTPARGLAQVVQKHAARVAGLPQESLKGQGVHILRRSMARALYERLVVEEHPEPLRIVQALLGHADSKTTRVYIGLKPDREERNKLLMGSNLLWTDRENVVELRRVSGE